MKFRLRDNSIGEIDFPKDFHRWISDYNQPYALDFCIDLTEEMPGDLFGYISCLINRDKGLALLSCLESKYVDIEGNGSYVIRDVNNIFDSVEDVEFRTFEGMRNGWQFPKHHLISMKKAALIVDFVIEHHSYPRYAKFDKRNNLNK